MSKSYEQRRQEIYGPLRAEGIFTWDFLYGEEYALASLHEIDRSYREEIAEATRGLGRIFKKTVEIVQQGGDELLAELGFPEETWPVLRVRVPLTGPTVIGRFDFAPTSDGLKLLELNSDTPTGIVEAFHVNGHVCRCYGAADPNEGMSEGLRTAFGRIVREYEQLGHPTEHIYFSALDWHEEDAGTTRYLLGMSGLRAEFAPLADLRVYEDFLYVDKGETLHPVNVLYRLHALEKLLEDRDQDGYPTGAHVLDLIARGKVAIINPPSGFAAQTKALQALIWNLQEAGAFYNPDERELIARYMLPTYLEDSFTGRCPFVTKPIFGREGGGVTLHDEQGRVVEKDGEDMYWEQPMIYQQRVELEKVCAQTLNGPMEGHLLWGSFLIDGEASGIVARIGGPITGNLSCYLPVAIRKQ